MKILFTQDPAEMSPTTRWLALLGARLASWIAPVMLIVLLGVAAAHFLFEVGNYPRPRARYAVGSLFLFFFAPLTGAIGYLARQRARELAAVDSESAKREKRS